MKTYWNISGKLNTIKEWQPNCWIQVTCPTEQEQQELEETYNIPDYFISDISDTDERARYEYDDGWMLIILRIPYVKEIRSRTPYTTVPLGIIHKRDVTITVCNFETNMMLDFVSFQQKRGEGFTDYVDMIFRLFLCSAVWYLKRLKQISTLIDKAKHNLDQEVNNESLIGLSRLQDSLTYFVTSIRGNENLLAKLKFKLQVDELDADLIEDVNIEMSQARETASIYTDILESTMDTYSSIINNNMNTVMRTLTSVSIIMMFPTLFYVRLRLFYVLPGASFLGVTLALMAVVALLTLAAPYLLRAIGMGDELLRELAILLSLLLFFVVVAAGVLHPDSAVRGTGADVDWLMVVYLILFVLSMGVVGYLFSHWVIPYIQLKLKKRTTNNSK